MNISEFAEYAGVSKSAVSRYFNNGYLSDDKFFGSRGKDSCY